MSKPRLKDLRSVVSVGVSNGTRYLKMTPRRSNGRVVIGLHGTPFASPWEDVLAPGGEFQAGLLRDGWTIYRPFTGMNFGSYTVNPARPGAKGLYAVDDMIALAESHGYNTDKVWLIGESGGGLTALNWIWRNPTRVGGFFGLGMAYNIVYNWTHDTPAAWLALGIGSLTVATEGIYGPDVVTASEPFDPNRNRDLLSVPELAGRMATYGARDDEVVDEEGFTDFANEIGLKIHWSAEPGKPGGGHVFNQDRPAWTPELLVEHFNKTLQL